MRFSRPGRFPIVECGSTVGRPGHLEDPRSTLNPFDAKAWAKAFATIEILDEPLDGFLEPPLLLLGVLGVVLQKPWQFLVRRHPVVILLTGGAKGLCTIFQHSNFAIVAPQSGGRYATNCL
jgi:hypothetical protein